MIAWPSSAWAHAIWFAPPQPPVRTATTGAAFFAELFALTGLTTLRLNKNALGRIDPAVVQLFRLGGYVDEGTGKKRHGLLLLHANPCKSPDEFIRKNVFKGAGFQGCYEQIASFFQRELHTKDGVIEQGRVHHKEWLGGSRSTFFEKRAEVFGYAKTKNL